MKDEIREKVFTAIGEASMCWEPIPTGVFDSTAAQKVGERLVADLASAVPVVKEQREEGLREVVVAKCEALIKESKDRNSAFDSGVTRSAQAVLWEILNFKPTPAPTYAECEAKAREYLLTLPDLKKGGE